MSSTAAPNGSMIQPALGIMQLARKGGAKVGMTTPGENDEKLSVGKWPLRSSAINGNSSSTLEEKAETLHEVDMLPNLLDDPDYLFRMASAGKVSEISAMCNAHPDRILSRDEKEASLLHYAAAEGKTKLMDYILTDLQGKTLLDEQDENGESPIFWAVHNDNASSVEYLIANKADPTWFNLRGEAPIHASIRGYRRNALRALIAHKDVVDVNQPRKFDLMRPMHVAAENDNEDAANDLLVAGAKLCRGCHQGRRPLHIAALHGSKKVMKLLVRKCVEFGYTHDQILSFCDNECCNPLHCAVLGGNIEAIEMCLEYGGKLDAQQFDGTTAMHIVCAQGDYDVVVRMFELDYEQAKKTLSIQDKQQHTPLHKAAMYGHADIVKYLVEHGANLEIMDSDENTSLLIAASRGNWISLQDLIELGANFMVKNIDDRNFLHMVVLGGGDIKRLELHHSDGTTYGDKFQGILSKPEIQVLLNQPDTEGCTPLHYACQEGNLASLDALMTLGVSAKMRTTGNQSALHFAARYGRFNTCKKLLDSPQGPNIINSKDNDGMTPLHYASQNGNVKIVRLLLNKGAVCHRNIKGESVLHVAASNGYTKTIKLLVQMNRMLLDAEDDGGNTPLHHGSQAKQVNTVILLLDLGAQIKRNAEGHTFFTQAITSQNREICLATVTHDRWNEAMKQFYVSKNTVGVASLLLIQYLPDIWIVALDRCIETAPNCSPKSKDYWIKYEFKYLQPNSNRREELERIFREKRTKLSGEAENGKQNKMPNFALPALNKMVQFDRVECLRHPVSTVYLQMKWNAYGRWVHALNLFVYLLVLIPLTYLVWTGNSSPSYHNEAFGSTSARVEYPVNYSTTRGVMILILTILSVSQLLKELGILFRQGAQYFMDVTNMVSCLLYVSSLLYVMPSFSGYPIHWQFEFGAVAVLLAWFNLLLFFQRFDATGIYVVMFLVILKTLLKVLALFSSLIVAFTLSFYALLNSEQDQSFSTPVLSFFRVITMTLGEINYTSMFLAPYVDGDDSTLHYPILTLILLICFIVVMPILLMNLLIGLAVGDIAEVQSNAELQRFAMQVQLHTEIENKLSKRMLKMVDKDELVVWPNQSCGPIQKVLALFTAKDESFPESAQTISSTDRGISELHAEIQRQKQRLKDMQDTLGKQHELMRLIVQKMEIRSEADNQDEGSSPDYQRPKRRKTVPGGARAKLAAANAFRAAIK